MALMLIRTLLPVTGLTHRIDRTSTERNIVSLWSLALVMPVSIPMLLTYPMDGTSTERSVVSLRSRALVRSIRMLPLTHRIDGISTVRSVVSPWNLVPPVIVSIRILLTHRID